MTTDTRVNTPNPTGAVLVKVAGICVVAGVLLSLVGAAFGGSPSALGALTGTAMTALVFIAGTYAVNAVAGKLPEASMLVALFVYTLQVLAILLMALAIEASGLLDETLAKGWIAAGIILVVAVWTVAQVRLTMQMRLPAYDLETGST